MKLIKPRQPKRRRLFGAVATIMVGVLALSACTSDANTSSPDTASDGKSGGTITYAMAAFPLNLDPNTNYLIQVASQPLIAIYGTLLYNDFKTGKVVLSFLESMESNDDYTVWTLKLHKDIKFTDGTPLNAEAIDFTIKRGADPKSGNQYQPLLAELTTEVVDEQTLQITLPEPDSGFQQVASLAFPMIASPTAVKKDGDSYGANPVGAGPFKLQQWIPNNKAVLVKNPDYSKVAPGKPYLDGITFALESGGTQQVSAALKTGQAQLVTTSGNAVVKDLQSSGAQVTSASASGGQWLAFNPNRPPFDDIRARQAVSYALNSQDLADSWTAGSTAMTSLFSKESPYYDPKATWNFAGQADLKAKARELFAQLEAEGKPVKFTVLFNTNYTGAAGYVQSALKGYPGVEVKVSTPLVAVYAQQRSAHNFQLLGTGGQFVNPIPVLQQIFETDGPTNYAQFSSPVVDEAIDRIKASGSEEVQKAGWAVVQEQIKDQFWIFPAFEGRIGLAYSEKLGGVTQIGYGNTPVYSELYLNK